MACRERALSFVEPAFVPFLVLALLAMRVAPGVQGRNLALLCASLLFYGWREPWFVLLLTLSIAIDWAAALAIEAWRGRTRLWVGISVAANLGMLSVFKYGDFIAENIIAIGIQVPASTGLPLPIGLSFFTFQSMAYTLDVARGTTHARRSPLTVATYVALFPQLVAGPIERAGTLMPQLERRTPATRADLARGMDLLLWGAVQKVVVADSLALYVDLVFAQPSPGPALTASAVIAFMVQILADFAGYTSMARGAARMMGIRLSRNFDRPYSATSPSMFWKRWHSTFSSWMHSYVYTPLAGPRRGSLRQVAATTVSLMLAGLWHGAAWHFVAWGAWFAAVMLVWRGTGDLLRTRPLLGWAFTMGAVAVGMLIFRAPSLSWLADVIGGWTTERDPHDAVLATGVVGLAAVGGAVLLVGGHLQRRPTSLRAPLWGLAAVLVLIFARDTARDFVYFRF